MKAHFCDIGASSFIMHTHSTVYDETQKTEQNRFQDFPGTKFFETDTETNIKILTRNCEADK